MPDIVYDEPAFARLLGPDMTIKVEYVAKAMCHYALSGQCSGKDGGRCVAFCIYGPLAYAAILAMQDLALTDARSQAWHAANPVPLKEDVRP